MARMLLTTTFAAACLIGSPAQAEIVGKVRTDWVGNDIVIEAIQDPKVQGVTCHLTYFDRSLIDRLQQGNWFEDPSNSAIACQTTGPVTIGNIDLDRAGEEVFTESRSLIFKKLVVNRIYDRQNNALIYLAHTRQVQQGSAKMSISTVPLYNMQATWTKGRPQ
ncbi:CreA family protein [Microvirga calopogonii]|uniref:CreA family protein n=1 Tax=Microvirga calopogonii TaxID=2078013 RepID=UPI000E0DD334|nr:CreA family protein [Microvirga calopogonii]